MPFTAAPATSDAPLVRLALWAGGGSALIAAASVLLWLGGRWLLAAAGWWELAPLVLALVVVGAGASWRWISPRRPTRLAPDAAAPLVAAGADSSDRAARFSAATAPSLDESPSDELLPEDEVVQQLTRRHTADGEWIHALVRADFAPGQRQQIVHVAFCPPLAGRPQVQVGQLAGPAATTTVALVETFGVRLEVRLARVAEAPLVVRLELAAESAG